MTRRREIHWMPMPAELLALAKADHADPRLWQRTDGESYRSTLGDIIAKQDAEGQVSDGMIRATENILRYNDARRATLPPMELIRGTAAETASRPAMATPGPTIRFNPPVNARQAALGLGFRSGSVIMRFSRQFKDFPLSVVADGHPQWLYWDLAGWVLLHEGEVRKAARRGAHNERTVRVKATTFEAMERRIAELEAKLQGHLPVPQTTV